MDSQTQTHTHRPEIVEVAQPIPLPADDEEEQTPLLVIPTNIWLRDGFQRSVRETGLYGSKFCDKILLIPPTYLNELATLMKFKDQDEMLVAILLFHIVLACFFPFFVVYEMTLFMVFIVKSTQRVKVECTEDEFWRFFLISVSWVCTKFLQVLVLVSPLAAAVTFTSWITNVALTAGVIFFYYGSTFSHITKKKVK